MKKSRVYLFWGAMDLFYLAWFCYLNVSQGRVPLYADYQSARLLNADHGLLPVLMVLMNGMLVGSMMFSVVLFFRSSRWASVLAYCQVPFRLLFAVPSVCFLLWFSKAVGITSGVVLMVFLLLSEVLKVVLIFFRDKLSPKDFGG